MKSKLMVFAVLLLGLAGVTGASYFHSETATFKIADRAAT